MTEEILFKYDVQVPRYTSYPSVPHWNNPPTPEQWKEIVKQSFIGFKGGISIYIHLPYCESLCTYCGCNTRITVNHHVEEPYISAILAEWELYLKVFGSKPLIKEIHLGGGTPTFFKPSNLANLINGLRIHSILAKDAELGLEAHPGVTTLEHLKTLSETGFNRISFGVQDTNPSTMHAINRHQTVEQIEQITRDARAYGFNSVNYDFVYGLPFQKKQDIINNASFVNQMKPDRIAFYSYAHVPWKRGGQRKFSERDLPSRMEKMELYETGRKLFNQAGYESIGMDHFAFHEDALYQAFQNEELHRNFMGYVPREPGMLIGLGCSSISDTGNCYAQNYPVVEDYLEAINKGKMAVYRGHSLTLEENRIKKHIESLMCYFETSWNESENDFFNNIEAELMETAKDGLTELSPGHLLITPLGKHFVRNICSIIDPNTRVKTENKNLFSKAI